jgi:hypothetical protein
MLLVRVCDGCASPKIFDVGAVPTLGGVVDITGANFGSNAEELSVFALGPCSQLEVLEADRKIQVYIQGGTGCGHDLWVAATPVPVVGTAAAKKGTKGKQGAVLRGKGTFGYAAAVVERISPRPSTRGGCVVLHGANFGSKEDKIDIDIELEVEEAKVAQAAGEAAENKVKAAKLWQQGTQKRRKRLPSSTFQLVDDSTLRVELPPGTGTGERNRLVITVDGVVGGGGFSYDVPIIYQTSIVSPEGGTLLISGMNFGTESSLLRVEIGGKEVPAARVELAKEHTTVRVIVGPQQPLVVMGGANVDRGNNGGGRRIGSACVDEEIDVCVSVDGQEAMSTFTYDKLPEPVKPPSKADKLLGITSDHNHGHSRGDSLQLPVLDALHGSSLQDLHALLQQHEGGCVGGGEGAEKGDAFTPPAANATDGSSGTESSRISPPVPSKSAKTRTISAMLKFNKKAAAASSATWERATSIEARTSKVAWQPDSEASECPCCGSAFVTTVGAMLSFASSKSKRRHHCRACGRCVCAECSKHRRYVRGYGPEEEEEEDLNASVVVEESYRPEEQSQAGGVEKPERVCEECDSAERLREEALGRLHVQLQKLEAKLGALQAEVLQLDYYDKMARLQASSASLQLASLRQQAQAVGGVGVGVEVDESIQQQVVLKQAEAAQLQAQIADLETQAEELYKFGCYDMRRREVIRAKEEAASPKGGGSTVKRCGASAEVQEALRELHSWVLAPVAATVRGGASGRIGVMGKWTPADYTHAHGQRHSCTQAPWRRVGQAGEAAEEEQRGPVKREHEEWCTTEYQQQLPPELLTRESDEPLQGSCEGCLLRCVSLGDMDTAEQLLALRRIAHELKVQRLLSGGGASPQRVSGANDGSGSFGPNLAAVATARSNAGNSNVVAASALPSFFAEITTICFLHGEEDEDEDDEADQGRASDTRKSLSTKRPLEDASVPHRLYLRLPIRGAVSMREWLVGRSGSTPNGGVGILHGSRGFGYPRPNEYQKQPVLMQLLQALSFLHEKGLVHADLCLESVLVAPDPAVDIGSVGVDEEDMYGPSTVYRVWLTGLSRLHLHTSTRAHAQTHSQNANEAIAMAVPPAVGMSHLSLVGLALPHQPQPQLGAEGVGGSPEEQSQPLWPRRQLAYAAPEELSGVAASGSFASDMWSFGVLVYKATFGVGAEPVALGKPRVEIPEQMKVAGGGGARGRNNLPAVVAEGEAAGGRGFGTWGRSRAWEQPAMEKEQVSAAPPPVAMVPVPTALRELLEKLLVVDPAVRLDARRSMVQPCFIGGQLGAWGGGLQGLSSASVAHHLGYAVDSPHGADAGGAGGAEGRIGGQRSRTVLFALDDKIELFEARLLALPRYPVEQVHTIRLRRNHLVEDVLTAFSDSATPRLNLRGDRRVRSDVFTTDALFKTLSVHYEREEGVDLDGLQKDMFMHFFEQLVVDSGKHQLFEGPDDSAAGGGNGIRHFHFLPKEGACSGEGGEERERRLEGVGRALLKVLIDGRTISKVFAPTLWRYLLDPRDPSVRQPPVEDLESFDRELATSMRQNLLLGTGKVDEWGLTFEGLGLADGQDGQDANGNSGAGGATRGRSGMRGGAITAETSVTEANKADYVRLKRAWKLVGCRERELQALRRGFKAHDLSTQLSHFNADDLMCVLTGPSELTAAQVLESVDFDWGSWDMPPKTKTVRTFVCTVRPFLEQAIHSLAPYCFPACSQPFPVSSTAAAPQAVDRGPRC